VLFVHEVRAGGEHEESVVPGETGLSEDDRGRGLAAVNPLN
jgi:hypothetical protein